MVDVGENTNLLFLVVVVSSSCGRYDTIVLRERDTHIANIISMLLECCQLFWTDDGHFAAAMCRYVLGMEIQARNLLKKRNWFALWYGYQLEEHDINAKREKKKTVR